MTPTIFCDIDGTLLVQVQGDTLQDILQRTPTVLPGVLDKLALWHERRYTVILTSARPEGSRQRTIEQLNEAGIYEYSQLILGLGWGPRFLINDHHVYEQGDTTLRAKAFAVERNVGLVGVDL